ncbi:uncharacterized protein LOC6560250 [Drosophila grimshawi]|uniref:GH19654 n=1 Tax=Drosophila grimshawi TaxID=7222 RepID=B4J5W1_DROGR|nr:uncharacterized protein LOC6560250 [Drosophila grimshawi]EDW00804.1 GH20816 [Drosophila grimshawi]EDW04482.1 GH19654 [Drosophila grimshawi]
MMFCKSTINGSGPLLAKSRFMAESLIRSYAKKHKPSPMCMKKKEVSCVNKHPKPRSAKNIRKTFPFYDLIKFKKECCETDCPEKDFASFDECLYTESDKNKRKYQITWVDCPPMAIKPKKICCYITSERPPFERRQRKFKPPTACQMFKCPDPQEKCPRLKMPHCRPVASKIKCHLIRAPSDCVKIKAPYPAFSECVRPKPRRKKRTECQCWDEIPMCDLLRVLNRRLNSGTTNMNPCHRPK